MTQIIKKILHFHFGKDGGAERFFVNLANAFREAEIEQKFVIRPHRVWRKEIEELGAIHENHYRRLSISTLFLNRQVDRIVRDWNPDAVMAWMPRAARLIKNWPDTFKVVRLGDFPRHLNHFRNCDMIVGNLPGIVEHCKELGWDKKTSVISNFAREVEPCPIDRSLFDTPKEVFLIAGAGRFVNRKGFDVLVRCLKSLPEAYLWLIGEGQEKSSLKSLAIKLGVLDRIRFTGWVDEPIHYIASADAFGMPSRHEPLGNSVLDAWRAKVPVVSTMSEGPSWYMRNGVDGMLVNIDATKDFAECLVAIRDDSHLGGRLVAGGSERLNDWFSRTKTVEKYLKQFRRRKES